jgi:signal transduction histidine kinase
MTMLAVTGWLAALAAAALARLADRRRAHRLELVARAAHELRGPLTAARLGLHALALDGSAAPVLAAVDRELCRAGRALDDLAAAREGRRAPERREPVELGALVGETVRAWAAVADAHGVALRLVWPAQAAVVRGDRIRLAQACANLISNAIEATALHHRGSGGPAAPRAVEVRGRVTVQAVRIELRDEGPGLPAPVATLAREARGGRGRRGRGLAIVAEIAARHGGRLAAAPSPGGARIALELPLAAGADVARPA